MKLNELLNIKYPIIQGGNEKLPCAADRVRREVRDNVLNRRTRKQTVWCLGTKADCRQRRHLGHQPIRYHGRRNQRERDPVFITREIKLRTHGKLYPVCH